MRDAPKRTSGNAGCLAIAFCIALVAQCNKANELERRIEALENTKPATEAPQ